MISVLSKTNVSLSLIHTLVSMADAPRVVSEDTIVIILDCTNQPLSHDAITHASVFVLVGAILPNLVWSAGHVAATMRVIRCFHSK